MASAGQPAKSAGLEVISRGVAASTTITKGNLVSFDASGNVINATTSTQRDVGFGVALETKDNGSGSAGDLKVRVMVNGYVYIKAGGTIQPQSLVKVNNSTTAVANSKPANATTPTAGEVDAARDYFGKTFGRYIGHENEEQEPTAAASTDVIIVRLGV